MARVPVIGAPALAFFWLTRVYRPALALIGPFVT